MKNKRYTQKELAKAINMNPATLNKKLNMQVDFRQSEVVNICKVLEIPAKEITKYFF